MLSTATKKACKLSAIKMQLNVFFINAHFYFE